jgi:hypothetical protein
VELDAVDRQLAVADRHHLAVGGRGRDLEDLGDARRRERVVAAGQELAVDPGEEAGAVVRDERCLPVDELAREVDLAAEREMTRWVGASASASSGVIASLRITSTSSPSWPKRSARL